MKTGSKSRNYNFEKPIYELFEEQAKKTPDREAYVYVSDNETKKITFGELDKKSSSLAYILQKNGVGTDVTVAVYMNRSINAYIAVLAILKAGGIYVPLDKSYPLKYLNNILIDLKPHTILFDDKIEYEAPLMLDINKIDFSGDDKYKRNNSINETALIMFTSGSTGRPKGVKHKQFQVLNRLFFMWERYPFKEESILAQRTTLNYMPSMWEIFGALLKGYKTIIFSDTIVLDPHKFLNKLYEYDITYLTVVPTLFKMMLSDKSFSEKASKIKVWTFCGEPVTSEIISSFRKKTRNAVLINDYGSTETNGILYYEIKSNSDNGTIIPYFDVIPNVEVYILDDYYKQVPFETIGTIYIGGIIISNGYISDDANKHKFININIDGENKTLLRVGDLGIMHVNHGIELIGREDNQVKIRGKRIDIDGIENIIKSIDGIRDAIIICSKRSNGNIFLNAYVTTDYDNLSNDEIKNCLIELLPDYMVPAEISIIDKIPLLSNGKVDRKTLENPKKAGSKMNNVNKIIEKVRKIASDILGIENVESNDERKFYEIGFDSASIVDFLNQLNETFKIELSISDLYDNSTISEICNNCIINKEISNSKMEESQNSDIKNKIEETEYLKKFINNITKIPVQEIDEFDSWFNIGLELDEQKLFTEKIKEQYGIEVSLKELKEYKNIAEIGEILRQKKDKNTNEIIAEEMKIPENSDLKDKNNKIAIIGMACKYAGADDIEEYIDNIINGRDCVTEIPASRWSYMKSDETKKYKWGGFCKDIEYFDNDYFNISEQEAIVMDPQQKICLEQAIHAIEDSGYAISNLSGKNIGVFIGARQGDYHYKVEKNGLNNRPYSFMGSDTAIVSARISYLLNLKGPCMTIDTACSSSMTAVCEAINSLKLKNCYEAIAGGVFIMNTDNLHVNSANMGMLSIDGKCKTWDDGADGFVPGEGAGIVILKRYEDALKDGDRIYGVIIASGMNQDGLTNGITAPSMESQYYLEESLYQNENINPETISYVEAHGTGTKLGDPIEVQALTKAFRKWTTKKGFCAIGSVKTNIGHTVAASGVASIIKVLLCFEKGIIPKTLNYNICNKFININDTPFYISEKAMPWYKANGIRRAAISSFGFGGSNCHMVLEDESTKTNKRKMERFFIPLSAKSKESLIEKISKFRKWLKNNDEIELGDISFTLTSIEKYEYRTALYANNKDELVDKLNSDLLEIKYCSNNIIIINGDDFEKCFSDVKELYMQGAVLNVKEYYLLNGYSIVSLPVYPFKKNKNYLEVIDNNYSVKDFIEKYNAYDHIVNGEVVIPGAAYLDYMSLYSEKEYNIIEKIEFVKIIGLDNSDCMISINTNEKGNKKTIEVNLCDSGNETLVAKAIFSSDYLPYIKEIDLHELKRKMHSELTREECYEKLNEIGLKYKKEYSLINKIYFNDNEALSEIIINNKNEYNLAPAIIDAAFQTVFPLLELGYEKENKYIPVGVDKIRLYGNVKNAKYVYAVKKAGDSSKVLQKYDIYVLGSDGTVLCFIQEFKRCRVNKNSELSIYKDEYIHKELEITNSINDEYILIINPYKSNNNRSFGTKIGSKLVDIYIGDNFEKISKYEYSICFKDENCIKMLFSELQTDGIAIKKVLYLCAYSDGKNSYIENMDNGLYNLVNIINALNYHGLKETIELIVCFDGTANNSMYYQALSGLSKSLKKENTKILLRTCDLCEQQYGSEEFIRTIKKEIIFSNCVDSIKYENGKRFAKEYRKIKELPHKVQKIKSTGVYAIIGGMGGIGTELAKYLKSNYNCTIVLIGRRNHSQIYESIGEYIRLDICDEKNTESAFESIIHKYGKIDGIFHCAGVCIDKLLKNKTCFDVEQVVSSKTIGLINLIKEVKKYGNGFIICFSSLAAVTGNVGQCDYAYANAFMDACSQKYDNIYSINWGLWKSGNMGKTEIIKENLKNEFGVLPIENQEGFSLMNTILNSGEKNVVVVKEKTCNTNKKAEIEKNTYSEEFIQYRKEISSELLKIAKSTLKIVRLDNKICFNDDEMDSISLMEFARSVSQKYEVSVTIATIMEYDNIEKLTEYIMNEKNIVQRNNVTEILPDIIEHFPNEETLSVIENQNSTSIGFSEEDNTIAIIGISGRFPDADDVDELWDNIIAGKNSITVIPEGRMNALYGKFDKSDYVKYAGLVKNIEVFDADYFNIPSQEAETMDPQQRILLEETVHCLENANIKIDSIKGKKIDVYVSVLSNDYSTVINESDNLFDPNVISGNDLSMLANRISYYFNLKGESITINTACSGALVCIKKAIDNIRTNKSEGAIVCAVNVLLDSTGFIRIGNLGLLNQDGKTKSFGENADGYVRGEGAGVIALRPLKNAIEDNNDILAVIKGCAVNHNGKGHYLMEPNAVAEAEVIKEAYQEARIPVDTVTYLECHGTGTPAGDANEIYAFKKAFKELNETKKTEIGSRVCALSTIKPNIGHLESASGIASIIKVIMALKHKMIPQTLMHDKIKSEYDFEKSPFYITNKNITWSPLKNENDKILPRRAGVHSYSFGGTNAHLILEEYIKNDEYDSKEYDNENMIFPFSAKSKEALNNYLIGFIQFLNKIDDAEMYKIACTLQDTRETYDEKVAFVTNNKSELIMLIKQYLNNEKSKSILQKTSKEISEITEVLCQEGTNEFISFMIEKNNIYGLAFLWANDIKISFSECFKNRKRYYTHIPTYCFEKNKYWVKKIKTTINNECTMGNSVNNDYTEKTIAEIIANNSNHSIEQIIECNDFKEIDLTSIALTKIKFQIESQYNIRVSMREIAETTNLKELFVLINSKRMVKNNE